MKNRIYILLLLLLPLTMRAQSAADRQAILSLLDQQVNDWNKGDIASFMKAYWESDSLMFVGKSGITYGYDATYKNYVKRYPDLATMGKLKFTFLNFTFPGKDVAFVVGKFHLTRPEKGDLEGHYTLLWRKIDNRWVIVCDHTSG